MRLTHLFLLLCVATSACVDKRDKKIYSAFKPVLMDSARINTDLFIGPARENKLITVMKRSGNRLYCLDYGLGLHIIDISNFSNPVKTGFYQIPACIDFEVNGDTVFANNYRDLIQIDLSKLNSPVIVKREANFF